METVTDIIREFLRLPAEAMPSAQFVDEDGCAWAYLRDAMLPPDKQQMNHVGDRIRLHADRDGWRDGVIVTA